MVVKNYDFKDELSKNFVKKIVEYEGEFVTGLGETIIYERAMYELKNINLVAIIKTEHYDEWYKKVDKYCLPSPDLVLVGNEKSIDRFILFIEKQKINLEKYNGEKHNEKALERRFEIETKLK